MLNKVMLIGRLGKDPEVRTLENGVNVARFSLATNKSYKDKNGEWQDLTEWHNLTSWRANADYAGRNLKKGMMIYVEGELTTRKWQDKDGNDRYTTEILVNNVQILEKRESSSTYPPMPSAQDAPPVTQSSGGGSTYSPPPVQHEDPASDDLPF